MFSKRIKNDQKFELVEDKLENDDIAQIETASIPNNLQKMRFHKKPEQKHRTALDKSFKAVEASGSNKNSYEPVSDELSAKQSIKPVPKSSLLSFLNNDDEDSKILHNIVNRGQKIIRENKDKSAWFTGIVELDIPLDVRLENMEQCQTAFQNQIEEILTKKIFRENKILIPDQDIIATGSIYVVPKFKEKEMEKNRKSTKEKVEEYLKKK